MAESPLPPVLGVSMQMTEKPTKLTFLERVADDNGVAVVVLNDAGSERSTANNNSICRTLWNSSEFRPLCDRDCGRAFERTHASAGTIRYVCHAGLTCEAVPVTDKGEPFVAIVGRTFLQADRYRIATERAISGDWSRFRPTEFFENVLMSGSDAGIVAAVSMLAKFMVRRAADILGIAEKQPEPHSAGVAAPAAEPPSRPVEPEKKITEIDRSTEAKPAEAVARPTVTARESAAEAAAWRSLFGSLMKLDYHSACSAILDHLSDTYSLRSAVWLDRRAKMLVPVVAAGDLADKTVRVALPVDSERLAEALKRERPLILKQRSAGSAAAGDRGLALFAVTVGAEVRSAFAFEPAELREEEISQLVRFAKAVGPQIEILRLRDEVSRRDWVSQGVRRFSDSLKKIDNEDFWMHVTQVSAELLQAERASLLVRSDKSDSLYAKASIGTAADLRQTTNIGSRIARHALDQGDPVIVRDIAEAGLQFAPSDWRYKTSSFISFPIMIGERRIAVMNFTDRASGDSFSERDLELLQTIAPQIAVAIDRTTLKDRAGQFEQLSVTDALTGLLNRRYLDERLDEEMSRARRHPTAMALMMIDVDSFKSYNDSFGHTAGDVALTMVASGLKETLRAEDVAARFGGEEFAILLPNTNYEEAAAIAERIRLRVEHTRFPNRQITISVGIAGLSTEFETSKDWITAADMALYEAKHLGRNNVQIYDMMGRSFKGRVN